MRDKRTLLKVIVLCCLLLGVMGAAAMRETAEGALGAVDYLHSILVTAGAMAAGIAIFIKRRIQR